MRFLVVREVRVVERQLPSWPRLNAPIGRLERAFALSVALFALAGTAKAEPIAAVQNVYVKTMASVANEITASPDFARLIKSQSEAAAKVNQASISQADTAWRKGDRSVIQPVLENALSTYLAKVVAKSDGLIAEIIVMDSKGRNVGVSSQTTDYWQGDEAKWQKTFGAKSNALFYDNVGFDQSTGAFSQQVSRRLSIAGRPAGAITIGFDIRYRHKK